MERQEWLSLFLSGCAGYLLCVESSINFFFVRIIATFTWVFYANLPIEDLVQNCIPVNRLREFYFMKWRAIFPYECND